MRPTRIIFYRFGIVERVSPRRSARPECSNGIHNLVLCSRRSAVAAPEMGCAASEILLGFLKLFFSTRALSFDGAQVRIIRTLSD